MERAPRTKKGFFAGGAAMLDGVTPVTVTGVNVTWETGGAKRPVAHNGYMVADEAGREQAVGPHRVGPREIAKITRRAGVPHVGFGRHAEVRRRERMPHLGHNFIWQRVIDSLADGTVSDTPPEWMFVADPAKYAAGGKHENSRYVMVTPDECAVVIPNEHELAAAGELVIVTLIDRTGGAILAHHAERGECGKDREPVAGMIRERLAA